MGNPVTISLDAMGGDHGPSVTVPAALQALKNNPDLRLILVGDEEILLQHLQQTKREPDERLRIQHASEQVGMCESPSQALRKKKDSSMRVAINLVKDGQSDACVSAGNTGALMATARFVLKMISTVDRPAICGILPTIGGHTHMLDMGANVDSSAENLFEFAVMGSVLASAVDNIEKPKIGLLNIGEEEIKGNERIKEASRLLADSALNYIGYVEGDGIYADKADVVVCDGFDGNIALKASEGVAKMISFKIREAFSKNI
ncbi:MAG: phosphate acyltransferase PlsX, partial [Gammaproteobacteria bacterium]|nr:phosphate acyltransferase PlsX [Gammaproteobacteria bacterium]